MSEKTIPQHLERKAILHIPRVAQELNRTANS
jgi:hypothetical protein